MNRLALRALACALAIAAFAVPVAGCGSSSQDKAASPLDNALGYVPSNSPLVISFETDPSGNQFKAAKRIVEKFPFANQTMTDVINGIYDKLVAEGRYGLTKTATSITVTDAQGFNLVGRTVNGLQQVSNSAGTVTRTLTSSIGYSSADVTLTGAAAGAETWVLTIGTTPYSYAAAAGETAATIAAQLASRAGRAAPASGSRVIHIGSAVSTVTLAISGVAPTGTASISGVLADQSQAGSTNFSSVTLTLPSAVRNGERWTATIGGISHSVTASGTDATAVASALAGAFSSASAYTVTPSGNAITARRDDGASFAATIAVTVAGSATYATESATRLLALASTTAGTQYTITLPEAGKRFMSMQLISQDEYSPPARCSGLC